MTLLRLTILVVVLGASVALALTNPTMDDYLRFVEQELGRALDRMDQQSSKREEQFIRNVFRVQTQSLVQSVVRPQTIRRNWGLLSRYETTVSGVRVVVIGVGGRFVPIRGIEEATVTIGRMAF